jgi:hypothetical protein
MPSSLAWSVAAIAFQRSGSVRRVHDLACVVHCHSTYSDGTGTVAQIAAAGRRAGADAVLLTDHDTLEAKRRGEERWYGSTLVCVGVEVSPRGGNHYLAFGLDEEIDHRGMTSRQIVAAVAAAGGVGFAAHPFSRGSERFKRAATGMPFDDLEAAGLTGLELWSLVTDTAETLGSLGAAARFIAAPGRTLDRPPARNLSGWDRLCRQRPVVAIGGVDAHQIGLRVGGRVPLRLMAYHRSFRHLRTHVLLDGAPTGDAARDRDAIYAALGAGRCYLAVDSLAPAAGFAFEGATRSGEAIRMGQEVPAQPLRLTARLPGPATLELLRDGEPIERAHGAEICAEVEAPGVYRIEATRPAHGRERTWVLSNPIYVR